MMTEKLIDQKKKTDIKTPYLWFFLLPLLISFSKCSSSETFIGTIDSLEVGKSLRLNLTHITKYSEVDSSLKEQINSYFDSPVIGLDNIKIYSASSILNDESVDVKIIIVPLKFSPFEGSYMVTSIVKDEVHKVRIWGNEFSNLDKDASIEEFSRQFDGKTMVPETNDILSKSEALSYINDLDEKTKYLFGHSLIMRTNSYLIRHTMASTSRQKIPEIEWYENIRDNMQLIEGKANFFDKMVDNTSLDQYREQAKKSTSELNSIITEIKDGTSPNKVRSWIKDYRKNSCGECHNIRVSPEGKIYKELRDEFFNHGFRTDLYQVGIDKWSIPGYEHQSQLLTDLIKAEMIYLSILK